MLRKIVAVGTNPEQLNLIDRELADNIRLISEYSSDEMSYLCSITREIPTESVYISIDKDVLSRDYAVTNWDQGNMRLDKLLNLLRILLRRRQVVGIDICGELSEPALYMFDSKHIDAVQLNQSANMAIIQAILVQNDNTTIKQA